MEEVLQDTLETYDLSHHVSSYIYSYVLKKGKWGLRSYCLYYRFFILKTIIVYNIVLLWKCVCVLACTCHGTCMRTQNNFWECFPIFRLIEAVSLVFCSCTPSWLTCELLIDSPVCASHPTVEVLGFQMCATASAFLCEFKRLNWEIFGLVWLVLLPSEPTTYPAELIN